MKIMANERDKNQGKKMTRMQGTIQQGRLKAQEYSQQILCGYVQSCTIEANSICIQTK